MASAAELVILLTAKDMASKVLSGFGKELGGMGTASKVAAVGLTGLVAAGAGLVAGIGAAVGEAMDFESAMSAVAAVAGGTEDDLKRLSDTALQLGQDTTLSGIGATDAALAMRELAAAGLSVDDIIGGAALGSLRLASAGGLDVARAAEIAAMALANFGLEGKDTARVADLFASAANSSAISVDDIAESMKYVGPIANSMGLSIEDVTATIAALGNQGIKGTQAGTALRSMFVSLAKPSKEANKIIKDLGLSFFDTGGRMKDIAGISEELKTGMAGLTDKQRAAALATLFGNEALTAATVLYGEGAEGINKWLSEIENGATAAEVGAKRNDNLRGSLEALKGSAETALIAFGMGLTPALKDLASSFATGVSAAIPFITALGAGLGQALATGIGVLQQFGGYVAGVVTAVVGAWQKLQAGEITLAQFIGGMKTLATTVLGDLGILLGKVGELLGPFLTKIGEGLRVALPIVGAELVKLGQAFGGWITTTAIPFLQQNLPLWLGALTTWITTTALPALGTAAGALAGALGGWITTTAIPFLTTNLPIWGAALWDWITNTAVPTVVGRVVGLANALTDWITTSAIPFLQEKLPQWGEALWGWITSTAVPTVTGAVVGLANAMADWVTTVAVPYLQEKLPQWGEAIWGYITDTAVPTVTGQVVGLANALSDWIGTQAIPRINEDMPGVTEAVIQGILNAQEQTNAPAEAWGRDIGERFGEGLVDAGVSAIGKAIENWKIVLMAGTATIPAMMLVAGKLIGDAIVEGMDSGLAKSVQKIAEFGAKLLLGVARIVAPVQVLALNIGLGIIQGILNGIENKAGELWAWLSSLPGKVQSSVGDMSSALYQAGVDIIQGLLSGIQSKFGAVQALLGDLTAMLPSWKGPPEKDAKLLFESGQLIMEGLIEGIDDKQLDLQKKLADVTSSIAKAATDMLGAFTAIASFNFETDSPTGEDLGWFRHLTESLLATMEEAASSFDEKALEHVGKFADAVGKVGGAVKAAVEGLTALGKTNWADASPDGNAMGWFMHLVQSLVQNFVDAGANFEEDGLKGAERFADAVGKVTGVISGAVTGLQALAKFVAPSEEKVSIFMKSLADLMEKFGTWAGRFEEDGLEASARFAEAAGKVVGILDNGVKGLMSLSTFVAPAETQVTLFMTSLSDLMEKFGTWAGNFEQDVLDSTSRFAEAAGKVAGVIGPAVAGFKDLATLSAPSETAIDQLMAGIRYIVKKFGEMATMLDTEGAKHLADFSDAAGKALAAAKTGTDLFKAFDKLGIPSAKAIDELMEGIKYVVRRFGEMAREVSEEGLTQLQAFATAAGQSLAAAKAGTDLFKSMEKLAVPSAEAIDFLLGTIGYIINRIREIANGIGIQGLAEAQAFATGSFNVINTLAGGLKIFEELEKFKNIPKEKLQELWTALEGALDFARKLFERAEAIKAEANAFANSMKEAARAFAEGMSIANGLPDTMPSAPMGVGGNGGGGGAPGGIGGKPVYVTINNPVSLGRDSTMAQQLANIVSGAQGKTIGYSI